MSNPWPTTHRCFSYPSNRVRQGCLLSPFLFLLAINWIMKTSISHHNNGIKWTLRDRLDNLDYADDLAALLSHIHHQMLEKNKVCSRKFWKARSVLKERTSERSAFPEIDWRDWPKTG